MGTFFHLRRPSWSRRFTLFAAASLGALMLGGVAAADTIVVTHLPFAAATGNPCTGEPIAVDGFLHFKTHTSFDDNGTLHFALEINVQDAEAVTPTGAKYVVAAEFSNHQNGVPPKNINVELMIQFIRLNETLDGTFVLDPGDDFWANIKVVFVVNANGVVAVDRFDFEPINCK